MKRLLIVIALGSGLALGGALEPARAADKEGYYTIQGVGLETCLAWLGERAEQSPISWYKQQWVLGYLTAYNRWVYDGTDISGGQNAETLFEWIDDYCNRTPRQSLSLATEALVWNLRDLK